MAPLPLSGFCRSADHGGGGYKTQSSGSQWIGLRSLPVPVIRFVREQCDVECYPGENLRDVALRSGIELYGLKGRLGNCGGCGQCITCFVDVVASASPAALSAPTAVEEQKLRRRPSSWRLACQTLVQQSVLVLTRPQVGLADAESLIAAARSQELPTGPTAWPDQPEDALPDVASGGEVDGDGPTTATSGEAAAKRPDQQ
jgi:ferredoxin